MKMELLDVKNSEESFKDMILDDDNDGSDIQYYSSNLIQIVEKIQMSNTDAVQQVFPPNNTNRIGDKKELYDNVLTSTIQGEMCDMNELYLNKTQKGDSQDGIEVVTTDYLEENKSSKVQCSYCNKFIRKRYIEEHLRRHRGEGTHNCDECKKYFQSSNELKRHYLTYDHKIYNTIDTDNITDSINPYIKIQCTYCNRFFSKNYIRMHEKEHRGETTQKCEVCEKVFRYASELKKHSKMHKYKNDGNKELNRDIFSSIIQGKMNDLIMDKTQKGSKGTHKCKECEKSFQSPSELYRHYIMHKKEHKRETNLKCQLCEQIFNFPSQLNKHIEKHRIKKYTKTYKYDLYDCLQCDCTLPFKNYNEVLNHIETHSDNLYKCDKCEKGFSRSDLLDEHVKYSHNKSPNQRVSVIQKVVPGKIDNLVLPSIHNESKAKKNTETDTNDKDKFKVTLTKKVKNEIMFSNLYKMTHTTDKHKFKDSLLEKVRNEIKVPNSNTIPHTGAYNKVGLLISANFLSREEIREHNADEIDLGNLNLDKLLKLKKFLADTLHDRIDKTEEILKGDYQVHKIVRAKVFDQHLVLTNINRDNLIVMERLMTEKSEEDIILEDDYYFILDADVAPELRVLISLLILKNGFVCSYVGCLTSCKQKATLAAHYMTHLGIRIKCDWRFCKQHFSKLSALEKHKKYHVKRTGVLNQFKCITCGKKFFRKDTLRKHIISHHGGDDLISFRTISRRENEVKYHSTSNSIFRQENEMETNESEEEDDVEVSPKKIEIVCSYQDCQLVFSSQWKLNMHKMSDH